MDASAVNELVNEALSAITEEKPWPWLDGVDSFATTADTASYALPDDWAQTRAVTIRGQEARRLNIADADQWQQLDQWAGPFAYALEGGNLLIVPTPDTGTEVVHRYRRTEALLVADTDEPLLPVQYHTAVVCYASALVCERLDKQSDRGPNFRAEYERWLRRMNDAMQRSQRPNRVRIRPGAAW